MEIILNNFNSDIVGIVLTIFSVLPMIYFDLKIYNLIVFIFQYHKIQHNQSITITNNIFIQQNNTASNVKDNKFLTFAINKETLKNIAIFLGVVAGSYLAYRIYKQFLQNNKQIESI